MIAPPIPKERALPPGTAARRDRPDPLASAVGSPSLLSVVAHELRAPLSSMLAGAELLLEQAETLDPNAVRDMLSAIRQSTIGLVELVENLLCASSIQVGRFGLQRQGLYPTDLIRRCRASPRQCCSRERQVLRLASRGRIPAVPADPRRIGQVLLNLISNASKFSSPGQSIDLTLGTRPERVRFTVADRGPGLPPSSGRRLFAPCGLTSRLAAAGGAGIGLGLAIVRAIVEAHGGRVGARNRRGGGAAVWFELPCATA